SQVLSWLARGTSRVEAERCARGDLDDESRTPCRHDRRPRKVPPWRPIWPLIAPHARGRSPPCLQAAPASGGGPSPPAGAGSARRKPKATWHAPGSLPPLDSLRLCSHSRGNGEEFRLSGGKEIDFRSHLTFARPGGQGIVDHRCQQARFLCRA